MNPSVCVEAVEKFGKSDHSSREKYIMIKLLYIYNRSILERKRQIMYKDLCHTCEAFSWTVTWPQFDTWHCFSGRSLYVSTCSSFFRTLLPSITRLLTMQAILVITICYFVHGTCIIAYPKATYCLSIHGLGFNVM